MSAFGDVEGAVKTLLRQAPVAGGRVFFDFPRPAQGEPTYPFVVIQRVGGGDDLGEAPLDVALVQVDVWGDLDASGHPAWASLMSVVNAVRDALYMLSGRTTIGDVDLFGAQEAGMVRLVDQANGRPRYSLTVEVTAVGTS